MRKLKIKSKSKKKVEHLLFLMAGTMMWLQVTFTAANRCNPHSYVGVD